MWGLFIIPRKTSLHPYFHFSRYTLSSLHIKFRMPYLFSISHTLFLPTTTALILFTLTLKFTPTHTHSSFLLTEPATVVDSYALLSYYIDGYFYAAKPKHYHTGARVPSSNCHNIRIKPNLENFNAIAKAKKRMVCNE